MLVPSKASQPIKRTPCIRQNKVLHAEQGAVHCCFKYQAPVSRFYNYESECPCAGKGVGVRVPQPMPVAGCVVGGFPCVLMWVML